jgi:hypothetical protein
MGTTWKDGSYSAEVRIHLLIGDRKLAVAQIGPDFLILRESRRVPNGRARLLISVDEAEEVQDVIVTQIGAESCELSYSQLSGPQAVN